MIKVLLLIIALSFTAVSCNGQSIPADQWTSYEFPDMGVRARFPCKPQSTSKIFQEKPKLARSFGMSCSTKEYNFALSLPERFGEYQEEMVEKELQEAEDMLKIILEEKASLTTRRAIFRNYPARESVIKNDWSIGRQILFSHEKGVYSIHVQRPDRTTTLTPKQLEEFEAVATAFINSFELLK